MLTYHLVKLVPISVYLPHQYMSLKLMSNNSLIKVYFLELKRNAIKLYDKT